MVLNLLSDSLAWLWDLIAMVIALVILLLVVKINGGIQKSGKLPTYVTRKIVHIVVAPIFLLTWLLFTGTQVSRYIAMIVPILFVVQFTAIGTGLLKDEDSVRSMSRSGDPKELLQGTLYYAIMIFVVTLFWFYVPTAGVSGGNPGAFIIIGCLAGGDGFADIIGRKFGGEKTFGIGGAKKTVAGAIGMFLGSFIFSMGLIAIFSFNIGQLLLPVLVISVVATLVELLSPPTVDNLTIPIVVIILIVVFATVIPGWWPYAIWTL